MTNYQAPVLDLQFLLQYIIRAPELWPQLGLTDADPDTANAILEEAAKLCEQVIAPLNREADEAGCQLENGQVEVPAGFNEAYAAYCEGGWGALGGDTDYEGMGMPKTLVACVEEMLQGANMAFGLAPMLTAGACLALNAHGSEALKRYYLPKLYSGQWSGAMDLTEPHAGTDLGLIRTKATPISGDKYRDINHGPTYQLTGTKIFITWGEHEMASNIVHLVLAKLPDAPAGPKGISLFLVPKFLPGGQGEPNDLGERNFFSCGALEKKMGIKASATCVMNFDGAIGWLVGEPHKGLAAMFTMMNYERLTVGIQAVAAAEASYQNARDYAKDRLQSRSASGVKQPHTEADPIIVHPDVRRMLLHMRAFNEAGRAFYLYVAQYLDIAKYSQDADAKAHAKGRFALLTPVAKAFMSDMALSAALEGQQVLGGHGFIREWGQEQYVRDIRITQIYEGTNGIQALDLLGRKVVANQGVWLQSFVDEVINFCARWAHSNNSVNAPDKQDEQAIWAGALINHAKQLAQVAQDITAQSLTPGAQANPEVVGAHANDFLHSLGLVAYGYLWLRMVAAAKGEAAGSAQFGLAYLHAKQHTCRYFFERELPKIHFLIARMQTKPSTLMAMNAEAF